MAPSMGRGILLPAVGETRDRSNVMVAPAARAVKKEARVQSKLPAFVAVSLGTAPQAASIPVVRSSSGLTPCEGVVS